MHTKGLTPQDLAEYGITDATLAMTCSSKKKPLQI